MESPLSSRLCVDLQEDALDQNARPTSARNRSLSPLASAAHRNDLISFLPRQSNITNDESRRVSLDPESAEEPTSDLWSELAADHRSHPSNDRMGSGDADDEDDSSIEVLLTIMPPSPIMRTPAKRKRPPENQADENRFNAVPYNGVVGSTAATIQHREADELDSFIPVSLALQTTSKKCCTMDLSTHALANGNYPMLVPLARDTACDSLPATGESSNTSDDRIPQGSPREAPDTNDFESKMPGRTSSFDCEMVPSLDVSYTDAADQTKGYSFLSSAYVQNLAEICHIILEDRRWRVGKHNERLFAWEFGDDLSAVTALARRYRPLTANSDSEKAPCIGMPWCHCHESHEEKDKGPNSVAHPASNLNVSTARNENVSPSLSSGARLPENNDYSCLKDEDTQDKSKEEKYSSSERNDKVRDGDSADDRCLHLYCRLFYRKGPWFRLDEVYMSYYAPKQAMMRQTTNGIQRSDSYTGEPTNEKRPTARSDDGDVKWTDMSEALLHRHCEALKLFFQDLTRLKEMGLIRHFHDEKECGQTVGNAARLLTAPERKDVLSKLGGGGKKGTAATLQRSIGIINAEPIRRNGSAPAAPEENEIWKQMCRQKSISSQFFKTNELSNQSKKEASPKQAGSLLPVLKHVNHLIFDRLATRVVEQGRATLKTIGKKRRVKMIVAEAIAACQQLASAKEPQVDTLLGSFGACIRLREAPLTALRRCARLFLCATSGPGQMRGGNNGWQLIPELERYHCLQRTELEWAPWAVKVAFYHSWHNVTYPGLLHRFGILSSSCFARAYIPITHDSGRHLMTYQEGIAPEQVFVSRHSFLCWEVSAELRATADILTEVNELVLYDARRQAREDGSSEQEPKDFNVNNASARDRMIKVTEHSPVDFLGLLTPGGRKQLVMAFVSSSFADKLGNVLREIEEEATQVLGGEEGSSMSTLKNDFEKILCAMAIVIKHLLIFRISSLTTLEMTAMVSRPWLRHMSYEACLSYILWDIIPILERRHLHSFAFQALELLIHGRCSRLPGPGLQLLEKLSLFAFNAEDRKAATVAKLLLSRRARGKALDRLVIDAGHILREQKSKGETRGVTKKGGKTKKSSGPSQQEIVANICRRALNYVVANASVSFASIRVLARRLKYPLSSILESLSPCAEVKELGLRLACSGESMRVDVQPNKYSDWVPITDHAVANSIPTDESVLGRRCSFLGHEDDQRGRGTFLSLNVEQLAMEFYASGRLPATGETDDVKGGYMGWHDEGGMLRALFRILSFDVLGMDWGCFRDPVEAEDALSERSTIHLSPYQGAPFDLHVGYELPDRLDGSDDGNTTGASRGFYLRKRHKIERFLSALESLSPQQASDVVWDSIAARRNFMVNRSRKDPSLEKDVSQCRTLSMVAAGFGGKMMAAMFRCFFFDYRHYSGGLPDLLLVRAVQKGSGHATVVDLGEWVGEAFDARYVAQLEARQRANLLWDRDDDFLGCSKVGDSAAGQSSRGRSGRTRQRASEKVNFAGRSASSFNIPPLPPKLQLIHNGVNVKVECMFVEVKSQNDRLDARQEDWLNILDRFGNARVCKFVDGKPKSEKKKK